MWLRWWLLSTNNTKAKEILMADLEAFSLKPKILKCTEIGMGWKSVKISLSYWTYTELTRLTKLKISHLFTCTPLTMEVSSIGENTPNYLLTFYVPLVQSSTSQMQFYTPQELVSMTICFGTILKVSLQVYLMKPEDWVFWFICGLSRMTRCSWTPRQTL